MGTIEKEKNRKGKKPRGFTLIELLVSIIVLGIAFLAMIFANTYIQRRNEASYEQMVAIQDAHRLIERIRDASITGAFPGNVTGAFPEGVPVAGFNNLSGEQITVNYNGALTVDPLNITITTQWNELGNRSRTVQLRTLMTQRRFS